MCVSSKRYRIHGGFFQRKSPFSQMCKIIHVLCRSNGCDQIVVSSCRIWAWFFWLKSHKSLVTQISEFHVSKLYMCSKFLLFALYFCPFSQENFCSLASGTFFRSWDTSSLRSPWDGRTPEQVVSVATRYCCAVLKTCGGRLRMYKVHSLSLCFLAKPNVKVQKVTNWMKHWASVKILGICWMERIVVAMLSCTRMHSSRLHLAKYWAQWEVGQHLRSYCLPERKKPWSEVSSKYTRPPSCQVLLSEYLDKSIFPLKSRCLSFSFEVKTNNSQIDDSGVVGCSENTLKMWTQTLFIASWNLKKRLKIWTEKRCSLCVDSLSGDTQERPHCVKWLFCQGSFEKWNDLKIVSLNHVWFCRTRVPKFSNS